MAQSLAVTTEQLATNIPIYHYVDQPVYGINEDINVVHLNRYFRFYDVLVDPRDAKAHIKDPTFLVFSADINILVFWFRFFTVKDLRILSKSHGIDPGRLAKGPLCQLLFQHSCLRKCCRLVYLFKVQTSPRKAVERVFETPQEISVTLSVTLVEKPTQTTTETGEPLTPQDENFDHLCPVDEAKKLSIIREWQEEMLTGKLEVVVCASCSKRVSKDDSKWVDGNSIDLRLLRNNLLHKRVLPTSYNLIAYNNAILNPKGLEHTDRVGHMRLCTKCNKALLASVMPKFALSNWLYYGHEALPSEVKESFDQATLFDKMLIARARCNSVTCRFNAKESEEPESINGNILARARKGIRGNVLVTPLDVFRMNKVIPPPSEYIRDTMCAVFVGDKVPTRSTLHKYSPVLVRKSRVKKMILFLLQYNLHYRPSNDFNFSEENLNSLFEQSNDDGVPSSVHIGHIPRNEAIDAAISDYTPRNIDADTNGDDADSLLMENVGYTDGDESPLSYQMMKAIALERCLQGKPFIVSGKGSQPLPDFYNSSILTWLFPHLDPWGIGGFHHPGRQIRLGMQEQLSHLLMIDNSPFERDSEFAFVFYNVCRKALVSQSLRFTVSHRLHRQIAEKILSIDPEVLGKLIVECQKNVLYTPTDEKEKETFRVLASLRMVAKHVPGSDGYKTMLRNEIRSLINYRGAPTLFITLNPSDVDHPIVRLFSGESIQLEDITRGEDMSEWKRKLLAARNPSACARFFDLFITKFITIILRYGRDSSGLYGKCVAYYGTVEAQGKGTLHCHMLIWLQGHLSPQQLRDKMSASKEYKEMVFQWLESVIKCEFPASPSIEMQRRNHPRRLLHKETADPHPGVIPIPHANVKEEETENFWKEYDESVKRLLYQYAWHEHQPTCWKYLERGQEKSDKNCRMGMNGETREVTELDDQLAILLRRHHPKIAPYTDVVTFLLQCNMDIKFVGSGEAAKAFLYYVTDYITKPSLPVHVGMSALSYAVKKAYVRIPNGLNECSNTQTVSAVIGAVNSMMSRQEISHPQVMSYLVGGGDHYTSHKFSIMQWGAIRSFSQQEWARHEAQAGSNTRDIDMMESNVDLALGEKTITASNQQLDYMYRNSEPKFSSLCLYDFVACTSKQRFASGTEMEADRSGSFSSMEHPQKSTHYLVLKREKTVPVILGPSIPNPNKTRETKEEWARDILLLFKPWRNVTDLKELNQSWVESFEQYEPELHPIHKQIIRNMHVLTECGEARDNHRRGRQDRQREELDGVLSMNMQDSEGNMHSVNLAEVYSHDPFRELDTLVDGSITEPTDTGDLLSEDASRLLDMCLPVNMEDLTDCARSLISLPSKTSENDTEDLLSHQAIMTRKRKRANRFVENEEQHEEPPRQRNRQGEAPIAMRAVLRDGFDVRANVQRGKQVCIEVINDMALENNREQLLAFNLVASHVIDRIDEQLLMHVTGVGGTGKSHLIKSIVMLFEKLNRRKDLVLGAPTGIAAVLIRGQTLHSLILATPTGKSRNISSLTEIWKHVKYLIVDEVSMVGARFLSQLSSRIRQGKGDDIKNSAKPFGGVNVIFMGDFGQLKPPKQNESGISALNGAFLWRQVNTVVELVKNQRQQADPVYAAFLDRLRLGVCSNTPVPPLTVNDLEYLKSRLLENQASNSSVMESFKDAPIIVGSKSLRDLLNVRLIKYHSRRTGSELQVYYSRDYLDKKLTYGHLQDRLWNLTSADNHEAFGRLPLFIGMRVMVTENLAFDNGIVNGSEGTIDDIKFEEDDTGRRYASVAYVLIPGCGIHIDGLDQDIVPIFPVITRIDHKITNSKAIKSKTFTRRQLPLVPAYVYTDFKSQGRTLTKVIVDLATARGQGIYVMLSRVKSLSGLLILRWFPATKVHHRLPEELRKELIRLKNLNIA